MIKFDQSSILMCLVQSLRLLQGTKRPHGMIYLWCPKPEDCEFRVPDEQILFGVYKSVIIGFWGVNRVLERSLGIIQVN